MIKNRSIQYGALLIIVAAIYAVFSFYVPYMYDDLSFINTYKSHDSGNSGFSLQALIDFSKEVRANDNGRLANVLSPVATLFTPKWLFAVITGLVVSLSFGLIIHIAGIKKKNRAPAFVILWISSLVFLPWRNAIMVNDYLLNYVYSSLAILLFIYLFSVTTRKVLSLFWLFISMLVAIIAGWFHEGFSVPLACSVALFLLGGKLKFSRQTWILAIFFFLSSVWVVTSPGIISRAGNVVNGRSLTESVTFFVSCMPAFLILCGFFFTSWFLPSLREYTRKLMQKPEFFLSVFASFFSMIVILVVKADSRASWPVELYSLIAIFSYFPFFFPGGFNKNMNIAAGVLAIIGVLFFINVIRFQRLLYIQDKEIISLMESSKTGTIFYDLTDPNKKRLETFFLPVSNQWVTSFQYIALNSRYDDKSDKNVKYYAVVPAALKDYRPSKSLSMKGNAGISSFNNILVAPASEFSYRDDNQYADEYNYDVITEDGRLHPSEIFFRLRFNSPDGNYYVYVRPLKRFDSKIIEVNRSAGG